MKSEERTKENKKTLPAAARHDEHTKQRTEAPHGLRGVVESPLSVAPKRAPFEYDFDFSLHDYGCQLADSD